MRRLYRWIALCLVLVILPSIPQAQCNESAYPEAIVECIKLAMADQSVELLDQLLAPDFVYVFTPDKGPNPMTQGREEWLATFNRIFSEVKAGGPKFLGFNFNMGALEFSDTCTDEVHDSWTLFGLGSVTEVTAMMTAGKGGRNHSPKPVKSTLRKWVTLEVIRKTSPHPRFLITRWEEREAAQ